MATKIAATPVREHWEELEPPAKPELTEVTFRISGLQQLPGGSFVLKDMPVGREVPVSEIRDVLARVGHNPHDIEAGIDHLCNVMWVASVSRVLAKRMREGLED